MAMIFSRLQAKQWEEASQLIHRALSTYYRHHFNDYRFGDNPAPFLIFPEIYESLDPNCCLTAMNRDSGAIKGLLFYHPRPTHVGIGIVATDPDAASVGIAKSLVKEVIQLANGKPCRLVSSAQNLASFSLYTKLGFVPQLLFQDVMLEVPADGLRWEVSETRNRSGVVRPASAEDLPSIVALEFSLSGLQRHQDYAHFISNPQQGWHLLVAEEDGLVTGFLASICRHDMAMLGPGTARCVEAMAQLIHAQLDWNFRDRDALWLVPASQTVLVNQAYGWGARNVELHVSSAQGATQALHPITLPTFMPESG